MKTMFYPREYKIILTAVLILCLLVLSSCSDMSVQKHYFFTMDTFAECTVITREESLGKEVNAKIEEICEEIENRISRTIDTSEIFKLNSGNTLDLVISQETVKLLELANYMSEQTNGAFNPNLGEIIDLWGINNNQDVNIQRKIPEADELESALSRASVNDGKIDLGGIGKGYAIDRISNYLADTGIPNALISLSSSVLAAGKNKDGNLWRIGIKDPITPDKTCGYLEAFDKVISVSGGYERFITIDGADYVHIIDPETGYPVDNDLICVVVVMSSQSAFQIKEQRGRVKNNGAISDALSTALFVMGKSKALDFYNASRLDFEMILFVRDDSPRGYDIIMTSVMFTEYK